MVNLTTSSGFVISIEVEFELQHGSNAAVVKPGDANVLDQLHNLLNNTITLSEITAPGKLVLGFEDRTVIHVKPHQTFEAWSLTGPAGEKVVSMPGGGLATWSANDASGTLA